MIALATIALGLQQGPVYEGISQVLVTRQDAGIAVLGIRQPDVAYQLSRDNVQTQVEVVQSRRVAEQVMRALGLNTTPRELLTHVSASADTGSHQDPWAAEPPPTSPTSPAARPTGQTSDPGRRTGRYKQHPNSSHGCISCRHSANCQLIR
jgi:uncharacterized protein involved in exopolysaccharide biosynthesis